MAVDWNPEQYNRFITQREAPFFELLALIKPLPTMRVVDLGCGTGKTTQALFDKLKPATTIGIDSSPAMIKAATPLMCEGLSFVEADIRSWVPDGALDLIVSNAALHWVDDHPRLLRRLRSLLAPGGQLAFQVPVNETHPSHSIANEVAHQEPFAAAMRGYQRTSPVLLPEVYAQLLNELGFVSQTVRLQVFGHQLPSVEAIIEWVSGSLLLAFKERLGELYPAFVERYREILLGRLPDSRPFFYTYRRVFCHGVLPNDLTT